MAGSNGSNNSKKDNIKLKIKLTSDDVDEKRVYITLDKAETEEHILKHWSEMLIRGCALDDIKVSMEDLDTDTEHEVSFRYYSKLDCCCIEGLWRENFVDRRSLRAGDVIGIGANPSPPATYKLLYFCVLERAS